MRNPAAPTTEEVEAIAVASEAATAYVEARLAGADEDTLELLLLRSKEAEAALNRLAQ